MASAKRQMPAVKKTGLKLMLASGGSGSVDVVTKITRGFARGTVTVETARLSFSNGQFQGASFIGAQQVDLLCP